MQEENNVAAQQAEFHGANIDEKQKSEKKKKKKNTIKMKKLRAS